MLHVANGDEALSALRGAGLPGEVVAWSDVLDQGPVRGDPGTAQFREVRARWLAENGAGSFDDAAAVSADFAQETCPAPARWTMLGHTCGGWCRVPQRGTHER